MKKKILVSGFKPFLGQSLNPSEKIAAELAVQFEDVKCVILPVEFKKSFTVLRDAIEVEKPDFLIMLGQASGRKKISLEKIALNWNQSKDADEAGFKPLPGPIIENSALALMSLFPADLIYDKLCDEFPTSLEISFSAGTYVCNELYYQVLKNFDAAVMKSVFIHLPLIAEQVPINDKPFMQYELQLKIMTQLIHSLR